VVVGTMTPTPNPTAIWPTAFAGITHNRQWQPFVQTFDGVEMLLVPAGCFTMGSDTNNADEAPAHEQCIEQPFWIDRYEVTNGQMAAFGVELDRPSWWTGENRPRETIRWTEAQSFCQSRGARLPTEAEWEYAARGPDSVTAAWVNGVSRYHRDTSAIFSNTANDETADVGSKPNGMTWIGALDMGGNVWEWTSSLYRDYPYDPDDGREDPASDDPRVIRGGSWYSSFSETRYSNRDRFGPTSTLNYLGFRCARDVEETPPGG